MCFYSGNVAYRKTASQVSYTWGDKFPADRAVDGNVDQWRSHEHCALPDRGQGTNAWWQVDLEGIFDILRVEIYSGNNKCKPRYFGSQCQFECQCRAGETCNDVTGKCPSDCPNKLWGVGCLLSSDNYYNDPRGTNYMGKFAHARTDVRCIPWIDQEKHTKFPDGGRTEAANYCRNPDGYINTWCYYNSGLNWAHCKLDNKCTYETIGH
ncbi:hypothetical protein NP493_1861g00033 [Ridgeia piscesae]|uniref:Kringle domain-containing protein n=1 Tax=Ridgeia piscesae TaxID=27915 RepID=A0AAD9JQP3_RIDPI|nr:hypothetical protein NP493_1861g00033 [Ridgeia piscesae]